MNRILIVEDESALAFALQDDLKLEGYEVEVVSDGDEGARRALQGDFDLVILDVMLPGKDGFEVCRELRRAGLPAAIMILTAKAQESEKVLGFDLGADDYVTKPFSPRELRARVRALLRRAGTVGAERYQFGDVAIDFARQEVSRGGREVKLTPIEYKLLSAFIHHRGRVLTREQLIDKVWGTQTFITDRVIDTHITNLRKKLEPVPGEPRYLMSVRGTGYRFDG